MRLANGSAKRVRALGAFLLVVSLLSILLVELVALGPGPVGAGSGPTFVFTAAGDFEGPGGGDMLSLAKRARYANASFLLALGDLGYTANEQGWCDSIRSEFSNVLVIAGNHDTGESSGGDINQYVAHCPFTLGVLVTGGPGTPGDGYGFEYYFDYPAVSPLVRFILITAGVTGSTNYNYSTGSSHYNWVVDAVRSARDAGIPWVVVGMHKQCVTVGSKSDCSMGQPMFDKLVDLKVDLILHGHDHVYERSHQIGLQGTCTTVPSGGGFNPDCIVGDGADNLYTKGGGSVDVIQGTGGHGLYTVTLDGTDGELGYFAQVMGDNANTKGLGKGYGPVIYEVSPTRIVARTDYCPPAGTDANGLCPSTASTTFQDAFTIAEPQHPVAQFTTSPQWPAVGPLVSFDASGSYDPGDPNASLEARWDFDGDGTWDTGWLSTLTTEHAYAAAGSYPVQLEVRNSAGLTDISTATVAVDGRPPVTGSSLSGTQGSNGWFTSDVSVTLSASDDLSGVSSTDYLIDGGPWQPYATPVDVATDGTHAVSYRSTDRAGNIEVALSVAFQRDTRPPSTTHSLNGTLGNGSWYASPVSVTLVSSDATSGIAGVQYRVDGGPLGTYASPVNVSGNGTHHFEYFATDLAGNQEPIRDVMFEIRIDSGGPLPPTTSLTLEGVAGSNGWFVSTVTATLSAESPSGGIPSIAYRLDNGSWEAYTGPTPVHDGQHVLEYYARDSSGAAETPRSRIILVDTAPPVVDTLAPGGTVTSSQVTISWSAVDATSGIDHFEVSVDGGPFVSLGHDTHLTVGLADGTHSARIRAIDVAGNPSTTTLVFAVDATVVGPTGLYRELPMFLVVGAVLTLLLVLAWRQRKKDPIRQEQLVARRALGIVK